MTSYSKTRLSGVLLMTRAAFSFSIMALCVKLASRTLPSLEVVFFRSLMGTVMILSFIFAKGAPILGKERGLMTLRGMSGFLALTLHFYTLAHLPLGTAVLLNYTAPLFSALLAALFLGEPLSPFLISMILISFSGVYLLAGGEIHHWNFMVFLGLLSAVFASISYVSIRAVKASESPLTVIFYFTGISTIGSLFFLPFGFKWPDAQAWLALVGVGIGSFYGQLWMTMALRQAPTSLISPFFYLTPLLSFFYGILFFHDRLSLRGMCGAILVILGGSLVPIFEARRSAEGSGGMG